MAARKKIERRLPLVLRVARARPKLLASILFGLAMAFFLPAAWLGVTRWLVGWDAGVVLYLGIMFFWVARSEIGHIRLHAANEDEGRLTILVLTVTATIVSLAAIILLLGQGEGKNEPERLIFAVATVLLSWAFVHTIFATHYAHEFYSEGKAASGLKFPDDNRPDYLDFVYFSFVIGMTFQVSDVQITSRSIRRTVIAHGIVSFLFNVALLAIVINIAASAI